MFARYRRECDGSRRNAPDGSVLAPRRVRVTLEFDHPVAAGMFGDRGVWRCEGGVLAGLVEAVVHPVGELADDVEPVVGSGPKLIGS